MPDANEHAARPPDDRQWPPIMAMPYPTEHAARVKEPDLFRRVRDITKAMRKKGWVIPAGIRVLGGPLKGEGWSVQAWRFDTAKWTADEARKWLKDNEHPYASFEEATGEASAADDGRDIALTGTVSVTAAAAGERLPRLHIVAYTGVEMDLAGWWRPVVIHLDGLALPKTMPILANHDVTTPVGHGTPAVQSGQLELEGVVSVQDSDAGREFVASAKAGFPWQASLGAKAITVVEHGEGSEFEANGRRFKATAKGLFEVKKARLREISVVAVGADEGTQVTVAASAAPGPGGTTMDFDAWLVKHGWDAAKITDAQKKDLKAAWEADPAGGKKPDATPAPAPAPTPAPAPAAAPIQGGARTEFARIDEEAAEYRRRQAVEELALGYFRGNPGRIDEIKAIATEAIDKRWNLRDTELALVRGARMTAPDPGRAQAPAPPQSLELEAGLALAGGLTKPESHYSAEVLERASRRFRHGLGLGELIVVTARAAGWTGHTLRSDIHGALIAAFGPSRLEAAFSTVDIGGILSNVANKFLLDGFMAVERTWRNICAVRNVPDFKTATSYRLIGKDQYELVGPAGEIKHGTLGEEPFTNKADTYALMLGISRRDMINDDLGAITTVPKKLGRGSGSKINDIFWTVFLNNGAFFAAGNKNYLAGADTALSIDGLTKMEALFMDQVDADGKPTGIMPAILLVPTALSATGTQLFKSLEIRDTTATTKYPVANPHVGKFRNEVSRYLANAKYPGNSAKAWYLLADPNDLPVVEIAFLDGKEAPTIETAEADFNLLGIQMRGYHDFGVALQDPRGGVKAKGEV
jgi:hypothetical protein